MDFFSPPGATTPRPVALRPDAKSAVPARCVLVADDERYIVDLLTVLLEEEGFRVLKACDGEEAWDLVRWVRPDLVISDVTMPRLDGLGLLRRLRSAAAFSGTPVILMSATRRTLETDRAAFVPKPFDIDRLLSLVETELAANQPVDHPAGGRCAAR